MVEGDAEGKQIGICSRDKAKFELDNGWPDEMLAGL